MTNPQRTDTSIESISSKKEYDSKLVEIDAEASETQKKFSAFMNNPKRRFPDLFRRFIPVIDVGSGYVAGLKAEFNIEALGNLKKMFDITPPAELPSALPALMKALEMSDMPQTLHAQPGDTDPDNAVSFTATDKTITITLGVKQYLQLAQAHSLNGMGSLPDVATHRSHPEQKKPYKAWSEEIREHFTGSQPEKSAEGIAR